MAAIASQNFVDAGSATAAAAAETGKSRGATVPPGPLTAATYLDDQRHLQEPSAFDQHHHHAQQQDQSPRKVS